MLMQIAGYSPSNLSSMNPNDIGTTFTNLHFNNPDQSCYMDARVSSHITSSQGIITISISFNPQPVFVDNDQCLPIKGSGNQFHKLLNKTYS